MQEHAKLKPLKLRYLMGGKKKGNKLPLWLFGSSGIVESGQKGEGNVADLCNLSGTQLS